MLQIHINETTLWDETNEEFIYVDETTLCLEHSLISISKWEAKWKKAFLSKQSKTKAEMDDYIRCMIISPKNDPNIINALTSSDYKKIEEYIDDSMSASTFLNMQSDKTTKSDTPTSDVIYYWMVMYKIPFECQKWHLNRLLTLINICNLKNQDNKISNKDIMRSNSEINKARRKAMNSKG